MQPRRARRVTPQGHDHGVGQEEGRTEKDDGTDDDSRSLNHPRSRLSPGPVSVPVLDSPGGVSPGGKPVALRRSGPGWVRSYGHLPPWTVPQRAAHTGGVGAMCLGGRRPEPGARSWFAGEVRTRRRGPLGLADLVAQIVECLRGTDRGQPGKHMRSTASRSVNSRRQGAPVGCSTISAKSSSTSR